MKKYNADINYVTENGNVTEIGKTAVYLPKTNWNGKGIKWFDDSQLIRKEK